MTFYEKELERIKSLCYSNQWQIDSVIATRNYIDNHFEQELNLNLLSRVRYMSKYHLLRLFKRYYGLTPKQYLRDRRIERSKELLRQGKTVSETCYAVGFESPSSFSSLFKTKTGLSPSQFRKSNFQEVV